MKYLTVSSLLSLALATSAAVRAVTSAAADVSARQSEFVTTDGTLQSRVVLKTIEKPSTCDKVADVETVLDFVEPVSCPLYLFLGVSGGKRLHFATFQAVEEVRVVRVREVQSGSSAGAGTGTTNTNGRHGECGEGTQE